jgi:hypothetical protein
MNHRKHSSQNGSMLVGALIASTIMMITFAAMGEMTRSLNKSVYTATAKNAETLLLQNLSMALQTDTLCPTLLDNKNKINKPPLNEDSMGSFQKIADEAGHSIAEVGMKLDGSVLSKIELSAIAVKSDNGTQQEVLAALKVQTTRSHSTFQVGAHNLPDIFINLVVEKSTNKIIACGSAPLPNVQPEAEQPVIDQPVDPVPAQPQSNSDTTNLGYYSSPKRVYMGATDLMNASWLTSNGYSSALKQKRINAFNSFPVKEFSASANFAPKWTKIDLSQASIGLPSDAKLAILKVSCSFATLMLWTDSNETLKPAAPRAFLGANSWVVQDYWDFVAVNEQLAAGGGLYGNWSDSSETIEVPLRKEVAGQNIIEVMLLVTKYPSSSGHCSVFLKGYRE